MAFLNRSRPISGIIAVVGALVGVPSLGVLVHTEWQKLRTSTSEVAACKDAEYQFKRVNKKADENLSAYVNYNESGLMGLVKKEQLRGDYILEVFRLSRDNVAHPIILKYIDACSPRISKEMRNHEYYVTSAPYWAVVAFPSLAIAGIALTINRRKEE